MFISKAIVRNHELRGSCRDQSIVSSMPGFAYRGLPQGGMRIRSIAQELSAISVSLGLPVESNQPNLMNPKARRFPRLSLIFC